MTGSSRKARPSPTAFPAVLLSLASCATTPRLPAAVEAAVEIDRVVLSIMREAGAQGLGLTLIDDGKVVLLSNAAKGERMFP